MSDNSREKRRLRRREKREERRKELEEDREVRKANKLAKCAKRKAERQCLTKHHLIPKSRGGGNTPENILLLEKGRHECWHCLFGNMTLGEVILSLAGLKETLEASYG